MGSIKHIIVIVIALVLFQLEGFSQEPNDVLQVVGKSSIKATPSNFVVSIPINVNDSIYITCHNRLINYLNRLYHDLGMIGVKNENIITSEFSISDNTYVEKGKRIHVGFKGFVRLQIKDAYSADKLGSIIKVIVHNRIPYSLSFELSKSQIEEFYEKAVNYAIEDAIKKANIIAKASSIELDRITKISYDNSNYRNDYLIIDGDFTTNEVFAVVEEMNFNISPKEIAIDKKVLIEWSIKK